MQPSLSRREFLATAAVASTALALHSPLTTAAAPASKKFPILAFSKPFANLNFEETADLVAEVGWDGIECPVRAKSTHIQPEKVEEDLPRMVEALKKRGKQVTIVTTDLTTLNPLGEKVLRTAARLGIKKYRLGFAKFTKDKPVMQTVREVGAALKDIAAFNKELGLQAGWQNHSGVDYVGASIWDVHSVIQDLSPQQIGFCFDIGHATLEGGLSWPNQARLAEPWMIAVFLKDFYWEKGAKGWAPRWCNFGQGSVQKSFLDWLQKSSFNGPLCQHHEYKDLGTGPAMVANMKKDLATLREWLA